MDKLVELGYITQEWADHAPEAFGYFYENIGPSLVSTNETVYPDSNVIFRAFKECSPADLKVVILGQDPYFDGSATGLAFDNRFDKKGKLSPSLNKILQEIQTDVGVSNYDPTGESWLEHLPSQGVLLLNTALTVEHRKPTSHAEMWAPFTDLIIESINKLDNVVWILWGAYAKAYESKVTNSTHKVITGTHPAARPSAPVPFSGGKYFSRANSHLSNTINW